LATSVRILVVEDHELFRRFICSTLGEGTEFKIIGEASDGLEAVRKTEELHPDLILLDIGLPSLSGIEAARRIHKLSPESKILFVSQESSIDIVREALGTGASGYIVKTDAGRELLQGVKAVLRGELFIGERFSGHHFVEGSGAVASQKPPAKDAFAPLQRSMEIDCRHEVGFYSDDASLLDGFTQFIGAALKSGSAVIVITTQSHRDGILLRLQAHGLDIGAAIEEGRYISLDAAETLSRFMVNDQPDPVRFQKAVSDTIMAAAKAVKGERPRVVACGECAPLLWARGNAEAAIRVEHLWDEIARTYNLDTLCGYPLGSLQAERDSLVFQRICAEHSAVHSH